MEGNNSELGSAKKAARGSWTKAQKLQAVAESNVKGANVADWMKSKTRPEWMTAEQYDDFPDELTVREVWVDGQILVTTLLNPRKVSKSALDQLQAQRWNVELDLRNIKPTLGVEVLRCLTPRMIEKELWVHLLAYNLIRLLMAQAALDAGLQPRRKR